APMLLAGRFIQGLASGVVYAVGTVWLRELAGDAHATSAAVNATAAMAFGFGAGSIVSAILVQWVVWPRLLSLVIMFVLVSGAALLTHRLPETRAGNPLSRISIGLPRGTGWGFVCYLAPCGLLVYSFVMLAIIAFPIQLAAAGFTQIYFIQGLSLIIIMAVATGATTLVRKLGPANTGWLAALLGAVGCALGYIAVQPGHWPWVLPASIAIGAGSGLAITSGVVVSDLLTPPERRGGLLALYYVLVYVGDCVPTGLSLAWGNRALERGSTILGLAGAALVIALLLAGPGRSLVRRHEHQPRHA
ncbi:MAG TPA: MFS transporter, partial [Nevskiaceae bacterium]|nr:MFS transporter [Nevskiaceae bacterium]